MNVEEPGSVEAQVLWGCCYTDSVLLDGVLGSWVTGRGLR